MHLKQWLSRKWVHVGACYDMHLDHEDDNLFFLDAKACKPNQRVIELREQEKPNNPKKITI